MNEFENYFANKKKEEAGRIATGSLLQSGKADGFAKARDLSRELDIPAGVIETAPKMFEDKLAQQKNTKALVNSDKIRSWLENPENTKIAGDDIEALTTIENWTGPGGRAVGRGVRRLQAVPTSFSLNRSAQQIEDAAKSFDQIFDDVMPRDKRDSLSRGGMHNAVNDARLQAQLRFDNSRQDPSIYLNRGVEQLDHIKAISERVSQIPMSDTARAFQTNTLDASENTIMGTLGAFVRDPIGGSAFLVETGAETLPVLAAATGATLATGGSGAGVATLAAGSFAVEQSANAIEYFNENEIDISTPEAAAQALQNPQIMSELAERGFARGGVIALFDAVSGGLAGRALASSPAGDVVVQAIAQTILGGAGEATAQIAAGQEYNAREIVIEALAETVTTPIDIAGIGGRGIIKSYIGSEKSGQSKESLERLDASVEQSQLKVRAPDKFLEALEASGRLDDNIYIPAEDVKEYFQSRNLPDAEVEKWGITEEQFQERVASGSDLVISVADYATNISGTDDAVFFHDNSVLDPDEFSVAQAERFNEEVGDIYQNAYEEDLELRRRELETRESDVQVFDGIFTQLRAAGRTNDVATQEATVWQSFYRSLAERTGEDSLDLARRFGVSINNSSNNSPSKRKRGEVDFLLNELRRSPPKPSGESLLQFIINAGGLQDAGGDLAALDAPKGLIATTRDQIQNRQVNLDGTPDDVAGSALDVAARSAVESGFFPELLGTIADNNTGEEADLVGPLMDALAEEISGRPRFRQGEEANKDLVSFQEMLDELGIDISQSNDEIVAQIEAAENGELFQSAPDVGSDAFKAWAGTDEVIDPDEINYTDFNGEGPFVMRAFHGTTHDFTEFDASVKGTKEGQFGAVNYFTSSEDDATSNYAGEGPDLTNRIERRFEEIQFEIEDMGIDEITDAYPKAGIELSDIEDDKDVAARKIARTELSGGQEKTLEVFIKTKKPFVVGGDNSPWLDIIDFDDLEKQAIELVAEDNDITIDDVNDRLDEFEVEIDEARWDIERETETPLIDAITNVVERGGYNVDIADIFNAIDDVRTDGSNHTNLEKILRESEALSYVEDPETGNLAGFHILGEIIQELGFDSIILKDAGERFASMNIHSGTAHVHVFDDNNTNIKSVDNQGTFDAGDPNIFNQEKRGSIQFPTGGLAEGETVINLFQEADLSTFLHESGHFFLEAFDFIANETQDGSDLKTDLKTIRDFLEVPEGENYQVEHHEKWARAFEAYALEGNAPSLALSDAFRRFKSWLMQIYRSIKNLDVNLTPEIRQVMDRMLATEAEIAAAREVQEMQPLFRTGPPAGMSDVDFKTYQRMARRSAEQADERLTKKTMQRVKRERAEWYKAERAAMRSQVEIEVNSRPEHRLIEQMANQTRFGSEAQVPDIRLKRSDLVDTFGEGVIPELSRSRFGGKRAIYADEGITVIEAATLFGFSSATEMVNTLQNTDKKADVINIETDRRMVERYGDPLNDGSIEEEALLAIHSDQQADTVLAEARHLSKQSGRPVGNLNAKALKERAKKMIANMSVREVMRPEIFLNAERKAARDAEKLFAQVARGSNKAGNAFAEAATAKERQALNHFLYREARDVEAIVSKGRERARGYETRKVREKIGSDFIEQIDALLERFDFRVQSRRQVASNESLREFVQRMTEEGRESELAISQKLLDASEKKHYSRMSVDEFRGLMDTVQNIEHMGRFKRKLIDQKNKRDLDETVDGILEQFDANVKARKPGRVARKGEARKKDVRDYLNLTLNTDTLLGEIDGFEKLGTTYQAIKQPIDEGMARLTERRLKMSNDLDAIYGVYDADTLREMGKSKSVPELGGEFTHWELISIALNTGNEDNYKRLTNEKTDGSFTPEQVDQALQRLNEQDWATVQSIWDYVSSYWPDISAKEKRATGLVPKKVETKLMVDAPDNVTGGYYPIKYDARLSARATEQDQKALTESLMGGRFGKAQTANGHTKERASNVLQPLQLDMSVLHNHLSQVLYDIEIGEAVTNSWRVLQDNRIKDAFTNSGKRADFEALEIWLQDVAAGDRVMARGIEKGLRHLRSGFVISRLAINVSTALIQPSGLAQTAVVVGKRATLAGTAEYLKNPKRWVDDVMASSAFMRERQTTFERDIFNVVGDLETGPVSGRWEKFQRDFIIPASFFMMQKVQFYVVDMPTWVSAYNQQIKKSPDEAKAKLYADRMVARAQGSGLTSDRGMLERGTTDKQSRQRELPRMFTALGSYMFAKGNVAYETTLSTNFRSPAEAFSWAMDIILLFTFEALAYSLVKGFGPEEDEELPEWLLKETGYSMMSTVPLLREVSGGLQGFGTGGILGSTIDKAIVRPVTQIKQGEADKALVKSLIDMSGIWLHLPSSQTNTIINTILDDDLSVKNDINTLEALGVGTGRGRSLADYFNEDN